MPEVADAVTDITAVSGDNRKGGNYVGLLSESILQIPESGT